MPENELENKIEDLSRMLGEQNMLIREQDDKIFALENKPAIDRYLDNQSKDIINDIISERILDVVWSDYYYYSSTFESIDRYLGITNATGTVTVTSTGLSISTFADAADEASAHLQLVDGTNLMKFDKETRFRASLTIDDVSGCIIIISTLRDLASAYIDFQISGGTVTGNCSDASSTSSVTLGTVTDGQKFIVEFHYYPNEKIVFFIDGIEKGTLTSNFPKDNGNDKQLFAAEITTSDTDGHVARINFFDFLQRK